MKPEQYRLEKSGLTWRVQVTWGLLDSEYLPRYFKTLADAKQAARIHAARFGVSSPIILR